MKKKYYVIVIGGGASGMMSAGQAAKRGRRVLLLEKNKKLGTKLALTGGGRCNICNAEENQRILLKNYGKMEKFLYSPFSQFGVLETFSFFESLGVPLKIEENQRAFPKSDKATDVIKALEDFMAEGNVEIKTDTKVECFVTKNNTILGVQVDGKVLSADSYILATGGKSHPETGSTGDGFEWLEQLGHEVVRPTPTIVPLSIKEQWIKELAGIALDNIKITFYLDDKKQLSLKGRILCTHFGISGPLILNASKKISNIIDDGIVSARIDLYPKLDLGSLDKYITKIFDENKNRNLKNVFKLISPPGTAQTILSLLPKIDPEKKIHSINRMERKQIITLLKALPLTVSGLMGYKRAVVADGGIITKDIEPKTMRSKKHPNLFVTGDLLHIMRPSGGYSLQLCWTTGWIAGNNA